MFRRIALIVAPLLVVVGCAQTPAMGEEEIRYGTISRIESVQINGPDEFGLGAIIGGVAGGVLGNQIGEGSGRAVATVAGVLAGGVAGEQVQKHVDKQPGQHIIVKLTNGVAVGITQPADPNLRVGDSVRIEGSGSDARVVRR